MQRTEEHEMLSQTVRRFVAEGKGVAQ